MKTYKFNLHIAVTADSVSNAWEQLESKLEEELQSGYFMDKFQLETASVLEASYSMGEFECQVQELGFKDLVEFTEITGVNHFTIKGKRFELINNRIFIQA